LLTRDTSAPVGDFCRVDRISRDTITLTEPVLSIGLAIQPDILATLAEGKNFRGSGLLARFLYAIPDSLVGGRNVDPDPLPEQVAAGYAAAVQRLARTVHTSAEAVDMKLTEPARLVLNQFRQELEPRLHPDYGDLANIADWSTSCPASWSALLPGQLVRIAARPAGPHCRPAHAVLRP
jgi:replicative DNA helicase